MSLRTPCKGTPTCWCCTGLVLMSAKAVGPVTNSSQLTPGNTKDDTRSQAASKEMSNRHTTTVGRPHLTTLSSMSLSAAQSRIRIQDAFCNLFFPVEGYPMHSMFQDSEPRGQAFTAAEQVRTDAADALCLIQVALGANHRDWLLQAMNMYGRTLARLQHAITRSKSSHAYASLIAAVYFMMKYETFLCTSWTSPGWMQHTLAFVQLLRVGIGKEETIGLGRWQFLRYSHCYALGYGLFHKRRVNLSPWLERSDTTYRSHISPGMRVPGCLEALEAVRQDDTGPGRTGKAIHSALRIRGELLDSLVSLSISTARPSYYRVGISRYPHFLSIAGRAGRMFPIAFDFPDFGTAMMHRDAWVQLLVLDQTILDLRRERWYLIGDMAMKELEGLEDELERISTNLCQILPYLSQPQIRCVGRVAIPETLHHLKEYFAKIYASRHLLWCEAIREATVLGHRISQIVSPCQGSHQGSRTGS